MEKNKIEFIETNLTDIKEIINEPKIKDFDIERCNVKLDAIFHCLEGEKKGKEELFTTFWDKWHSITGQPKTDMQAAKKYFLRLTKSEKEKALLNIHPFFNSLRDKSYCKKARTYLRDKNFNDEFKTINKDEWPEDFK